ncbi:Crp/Fnr family transcriptional regulator [Chitinophaga agri]|uniref:Crp/Fnr family transcriptional regulator n=1 Tax=Chitinophaga agri TaxID=2703787 RepID=A0A6B9ZE96_9BACT|nr:Crp/Fnr family transcriptional regulator [Chitinophaga agri]QHS60447.1 Crp/Fnr family transcriptional regulator [Chitinophaga agri]
MFFHFRHQFPQLNAYWDKYREFQQQLEVPAKTILLEEGKISQRYIYIEKGCVRTYFNKNGEEKTIQFFFEEEGLSSLDSFVNNVPSQFTIETVEPAVLYLMDKKHVLQLIEELSHEPDFIHMMLKMSVKRQTHYANEFVSFIRDTPEERYQHLLQDRPHIIQRIPQHYIASYLGVSTVHLSRIKSKLAKGKTRF